MTGSHRLWQAFALVCLLAVGGGHACAGSLPGASKMDALPSAPTPSITNLPVVRPAVHTGRVTIPRLDADPRLADFLAPSLGSRAAKQMLRVSDFIDRYPKDGSPVSEPTIAYLGYTKERQTAVI